MRCIPEVALAVFDESGKLADSKMVVFAGSVATAERWNVMSEKWNAEMGRRGIRYLTMKEAMHLRGEFQGRDPKERDELLLTLAESLHSIVGFHVAAPMSNAEFSGLPLHARQLLKNPQYCGFQACMHASVAFARNPNLKLALYCDSSEEYSVQCLKLYLKMRRLVAEFKDKCVSLTFSEDEHFPPLQAADMLAYCVRLDYTRDSAMPQPVIEKLLSIFGRDGTAHGGLSYTFGMSGLGDGSLSE